MNNKFSDDFINELIALIKLKSKENKDNSYTAELLRRGIGRISQKVGEEATEVVIAALTEEKKAFTSEVCDLLFHLLVLLEAKNVTMEDLKTEFSDRNHEDLDIIK